MHGVHWAARLPVTLGSYAALEMQALPSMASQLPRNLGWAACTRPLQRRFTFTNVATRGATYNFTVQPRNSLGQGPLSAVFKFKMPLP